MRPNMKVLGLILLCISGIFATRQPFIIGGIDTEITDYPFMVSLQVFGGHFCGGALFDSTHVVTAAHCVIGLLPSQLTLMMGSNSLDHPDAGGEVAYYDVAAITPHEDYDEPIYSNDIALILVDGEVDIDGVYVEPVLLAESDSEDFLGSECEIVGWGQTHDDISPDILKYAPATVIPEDECQNDHPFKVIDEGHICFRDDDGEFGTCYGDSGGPLVCNDSNGDRRLAGVTVYGDSGCEPSVAQFDARISYFYDWIQDNL